MRLPIDERGPSRTVRFAAARSRWHYGWVVAAITLLVLGTAAGGRSAPGALLAPIETDLGFSRAWTSAAVGVNLLVYAATAPFAAALCERFGPRRVVVAGVSLVALGWALSPFVHEPWQLVALWGVLVGGATGSIAVPLAAIVAVRWFHARRGLVTGVLTASNATGQLIFLPVLTHLAQGPGWRYAAACVAGVCALLVLPLVVLLFVDRPSDVDLPPYGLNAVEPAPPPTPAPFRAAIQGVVDVRRSGTFWLLAFSFFVCGLSTNGLIGTHLISAGLDHGVSSITSASYLAAIGVFDVVGTLASGWLTDRYDPRVLLFWYYGLRGLSLLLLHSVLGDLTVGLGLFVVFYGLDWVATVPPTIALCVDLVGRRRAGVVFAWVFASHQLGAAVAASGAGAIRDATGSYHWAFLIAGSACMLASLASVRIRPGPSREAIAEAA